MTLQATDASNVVLVLDDQKSIRMALTSSLRGRRFKVYSAASGRDAARKVAKVEPGLAFCDIHLGKDDDGISVAAALKRKNPQIQLVYLTAYGDPANRRRAVKEGAVAERWIDKRPGWVKAATDVACDVRSIASISRSQNDVFSWAKRHGVKQQGINELLALLRPASISRRLRQQSKPSSTKHYSSSQTPAVPELMGQLTGFLERLLSDYDDIGRRGAFWLALQTVVSENLWISFRNLKTDRYRLQLVQQFVAATQKIEPHQLLPTHLNAVRLTLERLKSDQLTISDVIECDDAWRQSDVETLPSFREVIKRWPSLYAITSVTRKLRRRIV